MTVFVKAVDLGSFAAAAAALDVSGPMVGKHVRFLEERLGVRLLNRTTRRQSLTEFGRAYYERCRVILAESEAADALASDQFSEPRGKLRVTMPTLFGRHCVAPALLELAQQHPMLELDLSFSDRISNLAEDGYDLAIRTGILADSTEVVARRVASQRMVVCASPSYLEAHGQPRQIEDIPSHHGIIYSRSGRLLPWQFPRHGQSPLEVTPLNRMRLDDLATIADAAAVGMGLAWLPSWLIRDYLKAGTLVQLLPDQPELLYDVHVLWLRTPRLTLKVRVAIDALISGLPGYME
ncbi:LysR substrate-binding domain-containing protein [Marinobacter sp. 71-i]|uniref:LysR substrate-binding domain-containing protein n=1 Tax=Marinobacter iranensis TaxID=2962607 RepID=A0ABT5YBQ3_9GAMM|nr:LysR substrate-binding domain-containing protein [Marinobacter iranensis]MDF0751100.1 LysR substrate-binding domain-containing protein [Marinobacter iranensis]